MENVLHFDFMVRKLRQFFQYEKGFIEVPSQSRTSILAACEDPKTITQYRLGGADYPLPQTGQMWLEAELLKNPEWPGVFCVTTSYRDEPHPIAGRHFRIFPMFEFEAAGNFSELRRLEEELVLYLGFGKLQGISYTDACHKYGCKTIESEHETILSEELGSCIALERFPQRTNPFWNMKHYWHDLYSKIDILLHGMETIGSAERETDKAKMYERFHTIENGEYANLLFSKFTKKRVMEELESYLALPMFERFGGGIGLTRLERAMQLSGLFEQPVAV
jgi:aspartyl/asparaginyl-tRNA synthetase